MVKTPSFLLDRPVSWTHAHMIEETASVIDAPTSAALGEALRFIRMSGIFYCPSELTEPWGLLLPPMADCLWFHVLISGSATIDVGDGAPVSVGNGDLVLVPHGTGHRAWGAEAAPTPSVSGHA